MRIRTFLYPLVFTGLALYGCLAAAQDTEGTGDDLDVSVGVIGQDQSPDSLVQDIQLPDSASQEGHDNSAQGLSTANDAREKAEDAKQARDEAGEDSSEAAEDASEHASSIANDARDLVNETSSDVRQAAQELSREAADQNHP